MSNWDLMNSERSRHLCSSAHRLSRRFSLVIEMAAPRGYELGEAWSDMNQRITQASNADFPGPAQAWRASLCNPGPVILSSACFCQASGVHWKLSSTKAAGLSNHSFSFASALTCGPVCRV